MPWFKRFAALAVGLLVALSPAQALANNFVDRGVSDALRLESADHRKAARVASDVFVTGLVAYPLLQSANLIRFEQSRSMGLHLLTVDAGAFAVTGGLTFLAKVLSDRDRPYVEKCRTDEDYDPACGTADGRNSFFSGHTSLAFTGAGPGVGRPPGPRPRPAPTLA